MVFSLLLLGAYATAKTGKRLANKEKWDKLVADYELERDFEKVLQLCGGGDYDINWTNKTPEINETVIDNCVTNLKTIPYLTEKDILNFEIKAWDTKLKQIEKQKEQEFNKSKTELQKMIEKMKNEPTRRVTVNIFKRNLRTIEYSKILYSMCKYTIWGDLIYNPNFKEWLQNNDLEKIDKEKEGILINSIEHPDSHWLKMPMPCGHTRDHEVWVVNQPIEYDAKEIYWKCRKVVEAGIVKTEEEQEAKNNKVAAESLLRHY